MYKSVQIFFGISCFLIWHSVSLYAQHAYTDDFTVQQFTNENGLPQNSIQFIVPDNAGFIWLGTEGGMVRFDGKNLKTFLPEGGSVQACRFHHAIPGMSTNSFFAANTKDDLFKIGNGHFAAYKGYFSASYWQMYQFALEANKYVDFGQLRGKITRGTPVIRILAKDTSSFYLHTVDGISYYKNARLVFTAPHPQHDYLNYFLLNGELYMHNKGHAFYYLDHQTKQFRIIEASGFPHEAETPFLLWHIITDRSYCYWRNTLFELTQRKNKTIRADTVLSGFDFEKHNIVSFYKDEGTGNLFLGSMSDGLFYLKKHVFEMLTLNDTGEDNVFYGHDYFGGNMVVVPQGYLLGKHIQKKWYRGPWSLERYSISKSSYGRKSVWAKEARRLFEIDTNGNILRNWFFENQPKNPVGTDIYLLYENKGALFFALRDGRIFRLAVADENPQPVLLATINSPTYMTQVRANELLVSSKNGLYIVAYNKTESHVIRVLKGSYISSMYVDEQQNLWCTALDEGLLLYRENRLYKFPLDNELFLRESHCILEDLDHNFWISGNRGLIKVPKQSLLDYADRKIANLYYFHFTKEYGLNSNEFNGGCEPCGVHWPDGKISFPSINGIVVFNPRYIQPNLPDDPLIIEDLLVDGIKTTICDTLYLAHDFQRVSMHFATPYLGNYKNLKLQVGIQSGSRDVIWHSLGEEQSFTFNTLRHGTHMLVVRKLVGADKYVYATLVIKVKPAFWQTWWFISGAVILFSLLIYFFLRLRLDYITQKNIQLERLISDRTQDLSETVDALKKSKQQLHEKSNLQQKIILAFSHDLKSPLMYLMYTSQKMYESMYKVPEEMTDSVKMMYDSSFSIYHSMDNFLHYAKIYFIKDKWDEEEFSLWELVDEKTNVFRLIAQSKNITISSDIHRNIYLRSNRVALSIVLHNLLDNAIKYTDEGQISIYSEYYGDYVSVHINDTGMGMDRDELKAYADFFAGVQQISQSHEFAVRGVGLQIVKEMMDMLKGKVELESVEGMGTQITLTFSAL